MDEDPVSYQMVGTVSKADDLEVVVRIARVEDESFVDVRDYIPSLGIYGRGTTVPVNAVVDLAQLLITSARDR